MMRDTVRKYMPYSLFEFDRIESWFEEMATKGLELTGMACRFAKFKRAEPRRVRYRIGRSDCGRRTKWETEYIDGCKDLGWDFVTRLGGEHYIFRTEDEDAVEFYSDTEAFRRGLERRIRWEILGGYAFVTIIAVNAFKSFPTIDSAGIFAHMVEFGFAIFPYGTILVLAGLTLSIWQLADLIKLRRRLRAGEAVEHNGCLCRDRPIRAAAFGLVLILFIVWLWYAWTAVYHLNHTETNFQQAYDYTYNFPLLGEINPGEGEAVWTNSGSDFVRFRHTELAPVIVMTRQHGATIEADTESGTIQRYYTVNYYELRSDWLAERYFQKRALSGAELTHDGLDGVVYDANLYSHSQSLLIWKGNAVLRVRYVGDSNILSYLDLFAADLA